MNPCLDDALKLDYLNGVISEREKALFENHLAACPECRREIAELRETADAVAALAPSSVPAAWADAAKNRLRAKIRHLVGGVLSGPPSMRRSAAVFQYAAIAAGVIAGLVLLFWLVMGGMLQRWLPGLSAAALNISEPGGTAPPRLVARLLLFLSLMFVPSIIDNIYLLSRRGSRRSDSGSSEASFAR